jgi:hypothetical protein
MAPQKPEEEQAEKGFTISDKRLFTREGRRRVAAEHTETQRTPSPTPEAPRVEEPPRPRPTTEGAPSRDMPPADFSTFVAMLANNVMVFLGQVPDPASKQRRRDLPQAKHTIDILIMLREKTRGNLTTEEARLLEELLPQLQMAYVSASRQVG